MELMLKDLEAQEQAKRDRAQRYESITRDIYRLERMVTMLEEKRAQATPGLDQLAQIVTLAEQLPANAITSKGTVFTAGGFCVRTLLLDLAGGAQKSVSIQVEKTDKALASTKKELAKARERMKEFQS